MIKIALFLWGETIIMEIKVSIIIPVYNVEKYLKRCLDSVLCQTYTNFEVILVDDGSTDNSRDICDEYKKYDKRIKVIHKNNEGVSVARNKGIEVATGKYILFLDSDDFIEKNCIEILIKSISNKKYDLVIYGYIMEFLNNDIENKVVTPNNKIYCKVEEYLNEFQYYRENGLFGYVWNKMYQTEILRKYDILFENNAFPEDVYFNFVYLQYCKEIMVINKSLYHYMHQSSHSLSKTQRNEPFTSHSLYNRTSEFLRGFNCYDINSKFINTVYIEALMNYILVQIYNDKKRIHKLKSLYNNPMVTYAISESHHNVPFYKIMNKLMKFKLPVTTIIFIYLYRIYDKFKDKVKRG